jgi:hypothetical protein
MSYRINKKATPGQLNYINNILLKEIEIQGERVPEDIESQLQSELLFVEASNIIDELKYLLGWQD